MASLSTENDHFSQYAAPVLYKNPRKNIGARSLIFHKKRMKKGLFST